MTVPRFTALRSPDPDSKTGRIYAHLKSEGGVWTSDGIAEELCIDVRSVASVLNNLRERGLVRRVSPSGRIPVRWEAA